MMKNKLKIFNYIFGLLLGLGYQASSFADTKNMGFEAWKARQQQHDERLKLQGKTHILQQRVVQVQSIQPLRTEEKVLPQQLGTSLKFNINTATRDEIVAKLEGIGHKKAQAIIDHRNQYGAFKHVNDLLNVKGIGQKTLDKNRDRIQLSD